jgi:HD domain
MDVDTLVNPPSRTSELALEVARQYSSPALLNHSIRSYAWAADHGSRHGIRFDPELLYVAALLHDIGLVTEFDSHTVPFEEAGGHVAWVFGAGAGWPAERRTRVNEVIVRHMWDEVDVADDPEGHLLALSTGLDISGRNAGDWSAELKAEILRRLPRLDLATEFVRCFEDQALRKPESTAAAAVRNGVAERIARNPLEH